MSFKKIKKKKKFNKMSRSTAKKNLSFHQGLTLKL